MFLSEVIIWVILDLTSKEKYGYNYGMPDIGFKIRYERLTGKYCITLYWQEPGDAPEEVKKRSLQWIVDPPQLQSIVKNFQKALDEPENLPQS